MATPDHSETFITLVDFVHLPDALKRFVHVVDGKVQPIDPTSTEAQMAYQQVLAALQAGTITDHDHCTFVRRLGFIRLCRTHTVCYEASI